jgi:hypothetical protein
MEPLLFATIKKMTTLEKKNYLGSFFKIHWYQVSIKANQDVENTSKLVVNIISIKEATKNNILYLNAVKAYMEVFLNMKNALYKYDITSVIVGRLVQKSTKAWMDVESTLKEYIIAGGDVEVISKANTFAEAVKAYTELESKQYEALYTFLQLMINEDEAFAEWKEKNEEAKTNKRKADENMMSCVEK